MAQYTYDPTQGKVVEVSQARVTTSIYNTPEEAQRSIGVMPATEIVQLGQNQPVTKVPKKKLEPIYDPFTDSLILPNPVRPYAPIPTPVPTTIVQPPAGNGDGTPTPVITPVNQENKQPGRAWVWNGSAWVKPPIPDGGSEKDYTWYDNLGWTKKSSVTSGSVVTAPQPSNTPTTNSAQFAVAEKILASYGITGFTAALSKIRADYPEADSETILKLFQYDPKYNEPFLTRFAANKARLAAGLPMVNAADYLAMEQGYKKLFSAYGLSSKFATQAIYDTLIQNDIDVTEATDRVVLAYDKLLSDKNTLDAFKKFFPALTNEDIVGAMLDPKNQIPELKRKVVAAEVGGQAAKQALVSSYAEQLTPGEPTGFSNIQRGTIGAEAAVAAGATKESAALAYQKIATELPIMEKLSSIYAYGLDQYSQQQAEQERILGLASAARKRERIVQREEASWQGSPGTTKVSLGGGKSNLI